VVPVEVGVHCVLLLFMVPGVFQLYIVDIAAVEKSKIFGSFLVMEIVVMIGLNFSSVHFKKCLIVVTRQHM